MRRILMALAGLALILLVGSTQLSHATCLLCGYCACGPANYDCGSRLCSHYGCDRGCVVSADFCCPPSPGGGGEPRRKRPIIVASNIFLEPQITLATPVMEVVATGDLEQMIAKIAAVLDVPTSTVHLRTAFVAVDGQADLPDNPGTHGTAVGNQGFIVRRDPLDEDATSSRYRLCRFTTGGPATRIGDAEVGPDKALIASMVLDGRQVILAIQPVVYDEETFQKDYEKIQGTFWLNAAEHVEEAGLTLVGAEASTECE